MDLTVVKTWRTSATALSRLLHVCKKLKEQEQRPNDGSKVL